MGVSLYYAFYPKKCKDKEIIPYLNIDPEDRYHGCRWCNGKLPGEFYEIVDKYSEWDEDNTCWIFDNVTNLFEFASKAECPTLMSDFITENYNENTPLFILWKR